MSDTCRLCPPFGDPWPSCLLPSHSAFSKTSLNIWKFTVHVLLKPGLENFENYFTGVWDECNCTVVWAFFSIAFLWDWNENWPFFPFQLSNGHCWVFQICWHIECSTFTASSFRIWNSSTAIPIPPRALFVVMLPKAHLTSHSRMSGSRWVITPQRIFDTENLKPHCPLCALLLGIYPSERCSCQHRWMISKFSFSA